MNSLASRDFRSWWSAKYRTATITRALNIPHVTANARSHIAGASSDPMAGSAIGVM